MRFLNNKKIILIVPKYYGYETIIKQGLEQRGASVKPVYENLCDFNLAARLVYVYFNRLYPIYSYIYYCIHTIFWLSHTDYVFVIRGSSLNKRFMDKLKKRCPRSCKFIMYQWDSVNNNKNALIIRGYFDKIFTFDPKDAKAYLWSYRPLFFDDSMICQAKNMKYDLLYVCMLHSERVEILNRLKKLCRRNGFRIFAKMYQKRIVYFKRKYINRRREYLAADDKDMIFHPLNVRDTYALYGQSRIVIDYTNPGQSGLTMRSVESLGTGCKLITNNKLIKDADFYNPNNIYVYEGTEIKIPESFAEMPFESIPDKIRDRYSLESFLDDIFQ